jgi:glycosyltransferase involved in cell wall biosynthesis
MRVAIAHDGFVPRYRVPLYERLASDGAAEYVVFHGAPPDAAGSIAAAPPFAFPNVEVRNREIRIGPKRLVHQHLVAAILTGGFDAVVLGDFARFTSSLALQPLLRLAHTPVILWGQVTDKDEDLGAAMRALTRANHHLKLVRARTADAYLAYTAGGARRLVDGGLLADRVFVVRNTLDMDAQQRLRDELASVAEADLRAELGLRQDSVVLLYVGRVYRAKRVPELLEAVGIIRRAGLLAAPLEVAVVGGGPQLPEVRATAAGMDGVHVLGEVSDQRAIARWMRVSGAVVIPGAVGLAINHAFAHGLPVITRPSALHGPEIEYLEDGVNGRLVAGDLEAFARGIAEVVGSPGRRAALAVGALRTAGALGLDAMVDAFDQAVGAVTSGERRRRKNREATTVPIR